MLSSSAVRGTFFHMVFQQNCTQGHSGHMIKIYVLFFYHYCVNYVAFILCHVRDQSFSCFIVVVVLFFFSLFLVVHCCGMTLFCLSLVHFTGTTKKSEVSKAARRHKDSNK